IYVQAQQDRVTVIFSTLFKEEVDRVLGKVFLQEFVDARRQASIQNAPQVFYSSREPPLEIRHLSGLKQDESVGYVSFVLFPRHFADAEVREKTISQIQLFRDYLHYHIKCAKAYMHSRMRTRVQDFLKVINRAKPDRSVAVADKKTATGRYFRPNFRQSVAASSQGEGGECFKSIANGFASARISQCTLGRTPAQLETLPSIGYINLGRVDYQTALVLQKQLSRQRISDIYAGPQNTRVEAGKRRLTDFILLVEHPPVYTNGRRNHGKVSKDEIQRLQSLGSQYVETNRGGEITFHGPGQLVVYPSVYLRDHHLGTKCYVEGLENTVVETCARLGVDANAIRGFPGVWVSSTKKVAALGTHVQKYVTSHGFALNCTTDMKWFRQIVPCGLEGKSAVSLEQVVVQNGSCVERPTVEAVTPVVLSSFAQVFGCQVRPLQELSPATFGAVQSLLQQISPPGIQTSQ
ncbi:Arp complex subunit, partial [Coemansia sp. RSA 486]